jgi:hypothetical protein
MDEATRTEAGCRAAEILTAVLEEHEDVCVSLACTGRLLAHGAPAVIEEVAKTLEELKSKERSELMGLVDLLPVNSLAALVRAKPVEVFAKVERQMSMSALIAAHAFFESTIKDLLRLTILCDREKWLGEVAGKSVVFEDIQSKGIEVCADEMFEKELSKLGLAGMPAMVARLLRFCKGNVTTKSVFQNYQLDMERLKVLDQLRHDYAHRRTKAPYSIPKAEADLRYLTVTAIHLILCIMDAFEIKGQHRPKTPAGC